MWREDKGSSHWSHRSSNEKSWCIFSASCDALEICSQNQTRSDALWCNGDFQERRYVTGAPLLSHWSHRSGGTGRETLAASSTFRRRGCAGGRAHSYVQCYVFLLLLITRVTSSNIMIMGRDVLGSKRTLTLQVYQFLITKFTSSK